MTLGLVLLISAPLHSLQHREESVPPICWQLGDLGSFTAQKRRSFSLISFFIKLLMVINSSKQLKHLEVLAGTGPMETSIECIEGVRKMSARFL